MIPKALHDQFLSQKALIILASSVSPESSKLPPAPRSLRSTCPSPEHSHPHAMANWFLLSPEASVFCYFSRGVSPPTLSTNKTGFVLTTPKSFYRIHTMIESGLIFFLLSPCRLLVCDGELSMSCIPPCSWGKKHSIGQSMDLKKCLFNKLID